MAKTRSQTGIIAVKKEEEDCKPFLLNDNSNSRRSNKIAEKAIKKNSLTAGHVKVEEDPDIKSLLQSSSENSTVSKGPIISQEQINRLIDAIVNENMSVKKASRKVKICYKTGLYYYHLCKNSSDKRIPLVSSLPMHPRRFSTQGKIEKLIRYINEDRMLIKKASAKVDMPYISAKLYYKRYLKDPDHSIPVIYSNSRYTQEQKNKLINYIVNDKMSITAASKKVKIGAGTGRRYYRKYFEEEHPDIPTPNHITPYNRCTQEQIQDLVSYIIDDKMSIAAASRKGNVTKVTAAKYYRK